MSKEITNIISEIQEAVFSLKKENKTLKIKINELEQKDDNSKLLEEKDSKISQLENELSNYKEKLNEIHIEVKKELVMDDESNLPEENVASSVSEDSETKESKTLVEETPIKIEEPNIEEPVASNPFSEEADNNPANETNSELELGSEKMVNEDSNEISTNEETSPIASDNNDLTPDKVESNPEEIQNENPFTEDVEPTPEPTSVSQSDTDSITNTNTDTSAETENKGETKAENTDNPFNNESPFDDEDEDEENVDDFFKNLSKETIE